MTMTNTYKENIKQLMYRTFAKGAKGEEGFQEEWEEVEKNIDKMIESQTPLYKIEHFSGLGGNWTDDMLMDLVNTTILSIREKKVVFESS